MSVFVQHRGNAEDKQFTVTISIDSMSSRYASITVNDARISSGTYTYDKGTEIVCTVSAQDTATNQHCYISIDGENVLSGAGSYTYKVSANCTITAARGSITAMGKSHAYGYITITTT